MSSPVPYLQESEVEGDQFLQMSRVWVCDCYRHYFWVELELVCSDIWSTGISVDWAVDWTFQSLELQQGRRGKSCSTNAHRQAERETTMCLPLYSVRLLSNSVFVNGTSTFYERYNCCITIAFTSLNTKCLSCIWGFTWRQESVCRYEYKLY